MSKIAPLTLGTAIFGNNAFSNYFLGASAQGYVQRLWNLVNGVVIPSLNGKNTPVAINATATATAAQITSGYITSTSAAAVALTLPSAAGILADLGLGAGTVFDFVVDNTAGSNTITVTLPASITVLATPVITGTDTLTVSTANEIGVFRLVFNSATAAQIIRLA